MSEAIEPSDLGSAIAAQLGLYQREVVEAVNAAGEKAMKKLVKRTKESAPKRTGEYGKAITYTEEENAVTGDKAFIWGAKGSQGRLTHLLVNGHPTVNGGRVPGTPFLQNAMDEVLPEYEKNVEEALTK